MAFLKCECHAGSNHSEIVLRSADNVPAEVGHPADMGSDADFNTTAELADSFGFAVAVCRSNRCPSDDDVVFLAAAKGADAP